MAVAVGSRPAVRKTAAKPFTLAHFQAWAKTVILDTGQPWILEDFQARFIEDVFRGIPECWLVIPEGNGKALACDTPIPTPTGWTEMGALQIGDRVFDEQGQSCRVTFATESRLDHPCYRVGFSDGTSVVADANHLWKVRDEYRGGCRTLDVVRTTEEIARKHRIDHSGWRCHRFSVPATRPLDLTDALVPIEPYVLGTWLGDGETAGGRITFGEPFVREEIERLGYVVAGGNDCGGSRVPTASVYGLRKALRELGVLGNKHIPTLYLRGSYTQRLSLLQGLMDTDGTISAPQGQCSLTTISRPLGRGVLELVRSLGLKATVREIRTKIAGRDCGPAWIVQFHAYRNQPVFRMPRKLERQRSRPNRRSLSETRRIIDVISVPSVPVRCIQVDSPSSLYLAGEGMVATHNTTLVAGLALYHCQHRPSAEVPVAASSRDQAGILYRQAEGFIIRTPWMKEVFNSLPGFREIRYEPDGVSRIKVFAADDRTGDGVIPTLCVIDELHRHRDLKLYRTWRGKLDKRHGQVVTISTAGEPGAEFEETRERIRDAADAIRRSKTFVRAASKKLLLHEWAVPEDGDVHDLKLVKRANPFSGVTLEDLRRKQESPTMTEGHWRRFNCNQPTRSDRAAIQESEWQAAATSEQIPEGTPVWVGLDLSWKWDTTAVVPLWIRESKFRLFGPARVLVPPRDATSLDPKLVEEALLSVHTRNPIHTVVMNVSRAQHVAAWITEQLGARVVDRPQSQPLAAMDYERFMEALRNGWLKHTGDRALTRHAMNAVARVSISGQACFEPHSRSVEGGDQEQRVIDALIAAAMVHNVAAAELLAPAAVPLVAFR